VPATLYATRPISLEAHVCDLIRFRATLVNIERITVSLNFRTAKACSRLESLMETLSTSNFSESLFSVCDGSP